MNKFSALISVFFLYAISNAQHESAGTTYFALLNNSVDARSIGMAGAATGIPNSLYCSFSNPAVLGADTSSLDVFLGYTSIFEGGFCGVPLAVSRSFGKYGVFGVNAFSANTSVEGVDADNKKTGEDASYNYFNGGVSWGHHYGERIFYGASLKGVYEKVADYSHAAMLLDAGVQYRMNSDRLIYGFTIRNLGFVVKEFDYDESDGDLPLTFEAGLSFVPRPIPALRMAIDVNKKIGDYVNFEPALEINVYKKYLALRLGYAFSQRDASYVWDKLQNEENDDYVKSNLSSLCVGAGLKTDIANKKIAVDFGMQFRSVMITPEISLSAIIAL